jgi:hypothetical protein
MQEAEIRRIVAPDQANAKKFGRPHLNEKKAVCGSMSLSFQQWQKVENRRLAVQAGLDYNQHLISKITRVKRASGKVREVEHVPSKCEALSSNPKATTTKTCSPENCQ